MYTRAQYQQDLAAAQAEYNRTQDKAKFESTLLGIQSKMLNEIANNSKGHDFDLGTDPGLLVNLLPSVEAKKKAEQMIATKQGIAQSSLDLLNQGVQMAMSLGQVSRARQAAAQLQLSHPAKQSD